MCRPVISTPEISSWNASPCTDAFRPRHTTRAKAQPSEKRPLHYYFLAALVAGFLEVAVRRRQVACERVARQKAATTIELRQKRDAAAVGLAVILAAELGHHRERAFCHVVDERQEPIDVVAVDVGQHGQLEPFCHR
jgi:hypothetical protein